MKKKVRVRIQDRWFLVELEETSENVYTAVVEGEEFAPEEDDVIIFEGIHWHQLAKHKRRVVLVMTYI